MPTTVLAGPSGVAAGLWAFLVVVGLVVACVFLFRSMNTQLRRVPRSFDGDQPNAEEPPGRPTRRRRR